jgi:hypothetical protein
MLDVPIVLPVITSVPFLCSWFRQNGSHALSLVTSVLVLCTYISSLSRFDVMQVMFA